MVILINLYPRIIVNIFLINLIVVIIIYIEHRKFCSTSTNEFPADNNCQFHFFFFFTRIRLITVVLKLFLP